MSLKAPASPAEDNRRAANGYLVWPLALADIVREDGAATGWARLHARQAFVLGIVGSLCFFAVLALPLAAVIAIPAISTGTTIVVYGVGLLADACVGIALLVLAVRCATRAARGELFAIPIVTPLADRLYRAKRP